MLKEQLAEYLHRYHHGAENTVTSRMLEHAFHISGKELRDLVNALRREGIPIASDQSMAILLAMEVTSSSLKASPEFKNFNVTALYIAPVSI